MTLLTLLQGEASTENAVKASEQSKILAVFTLVTVVFVRAYSDCRHLKARGLLTK